MKPLHGLCKGTSSLEDDQVLDLSIKLIMIQLDRGVLKACPWRGIYLYVPPLAKLVVLLKKTPQPPRRLF